ncbi:MAG: ATP-binding protein, partial [Candidatus Eremiobacterales bacterium]
PTTLATEPTSAAPATDARGAEGVLPFVGRDAELDQLRAAWVRAARGNGGLVFVCGQAGIGKSRLVAELARSVEAEGGRVCHGTTTPSERFPYEGIVEALRYSLPYVASLDLDALSYAIIAQLLPELAAWHDVASSVPPIDPSREQPRLLDAVASCIAAMARPRPLLVVLEDLHWAGADTAAAIAFLARRLARSAVLIVGTYREEEVGRTHPLRAVHQGLRGEQLVQSIALRPLSESAVERIVERLAVPPEDRARVARLGFDRSEGNPLFLTEALRDALRAPSDAGHEWTGSDALRSLIASRVASLSDDARDIARIAAVVGHGFQVDLLRDVAGIEESKVLDGLYELLDHNLVREAGARRRFDFAFTHHLIHNAIYEDIEPAVRTRRHRRIAQIIRERGAGDGGFTAADLALHRERGGDSGGAAISYVDAARHATALFANDDAIRHATKAIELSEDDVLRAQALLVRERALGRAARKDLQEQDIESLREISVRSKDDDLAWEVSTLTVAFTRSQSDREKQDGAVADLERRAAASGIPRRRAESLLARADLLVLRTSHAE